MTDVLRVRWPCPLTMDSIEGIRMILDKEDGEVYIDEKDNTILCIVGGTDEEIKELEEQCKFLLLKVD